MSDWRLLDRDESGMQTFFDSDDDGNWHLKYEQDVDPVLDANKSSQADGFDKRAEMWHAARIPNVIIMEWVNKFGVNLWDPNHKDGVRRLLNHPDYRYLRVNHFIM